MALVVEDGTGKSNANAYVDVASVTSYAADRNYTAWAGYSTPVQEAAIIAATFYLDSKYIFIGQKATAAQALAWPRVGASDVNDGVDYAANSIPLSLRRAVMELAVKAGAGTNLMPDLAHGGQVKSESVGPISVTYMDNADPTTKFMVTGLIKGLVRPSDSTYGMLAHEPSYTADPYFEPDQFNNVGDVQSPGGR